MTQKQYSPSENYRRRNRALWPWFLLAAISAIALIWLIAVVAQRMIVNQAPATADSIKEAVGSSACKRRVLQKMVEQGQIVTNMDLVHIQGPCKINDEQQEALTH
nr:hypothetical protein [uncultured bacterium]